MDFHMIRLCSVVFYLCMAFIYCTASQNTSLCPSIARKSGSFLKVFRNTCYMFVDREMYWSTARDSCWRMGGEMVTIKDMDTMNFIKSTLNSRELGWSRNGVWNGASDLRGRSWEWTTGEKLTFQYWASGEPRKFLNLLSLENCCCMRRSDGWRWHDYHCHLDPYEYNSICEFPLMTPTNTQQFHTASDTSGKEGNNEKVAVIGLCVGAVLLLVLVFSISFYLYKKHERQKAMLKHHQQVLFTNTGYATVMQNTSSAGSATESETMSTSTANNMYLEPSEITRIYEDINKNTSHGVNSLNGTTQGTQLFYTGGACAAGDDEAGLFTTTLPSEASGATSGYCSSVTERKTGESDYVEMNGANSIAHSHSSDSGLGLNGSVASAPACDTQIVLKDVNGASNLSDRASNVYVKACKNVNVDKLNNSDTEAKPSNVEMHVYTNQTELLDQRPLPPIPTDDERTPLCKTNQ